MGDGWIAQRGKSYRFGVGLAEKDKNHLSRFCDDIKLDSSKIKIKNNYMKNKVHKLYYIELTNKNLYSSLSNWGITLNKTRKFFEPNIKKELIGHYIRGWFDADGCANLNGKITKQINLCGHPEAMQYFENNLKILGFNKNICKQNKNKIDIYVISSLEGIKRFYNICNGNDLLRLERKWSLIENYVFEQGELS